MPNLLTFGSNDSHQLLLGAETTDDVLLPSPAPTPSISIASIAFGSSHTVLLSNSGVVYTLGANDNGQCGVSTVVANDVLSSPVRLESLATTYTITQIAAGGSHSAAVTSCGQMATFGANDSGQCGLGESAPLDVRKPKLVKALESTEVAQVACGDSHTLVLDLGARVHACGQGRFGALGLDNTPGSVSQTQPTPCIITALAAAPIRMLAAGAQHSVALTFGGAVLTWGFAREGALGLPHASAAERCVGVPRLVPALRKNVVSIAAGGSHTLALLADGTLMGFGKGASGAAPTDSHSPVAIHLPEGAAGGRKITQIAAGRTHSLLLLDDGRALAWGAARSGQVGFGDTVDVLAPKFVGRVASGENGETSGAEPLSARVRRIAAGGHSSALLLKGDEMDVGIGGLAPRQPATLSLEEVQRLSSDGDWKALESLVSAVFASPALVNASYADEPRGGLRPTLEPTYVALLKCYHKAPAVLDALRESVPVLLEGLRTALIDAGSGAGPLIPPSPSRTPSGKSASSSSAIDISTPRSPSSAAATQRAYRHNFVLTPIAVALHNPLLSHASEAQHLLTIAGIVDESLNHDGRHRLMLLLAKQPADVFAARVVRPLIAAIERAVASERAGGGSTLGEVVSLVRLLGLARDANEHARKRAAELDAVCGGAGGSSSDGGSSSTSAAPSSDNNSMAPGTIDAGEFYSPFLSEHLDAQRDYVNWANHGSLDRGVNFRNGWSFCSEPWILNPQAKARLLQVEASIKMAQSQHSAVAQAMSGRSAPQSGSVLLPSKRRRRENKSVPDDSQPPAAPDPKSPFLILRVRRSHLVEDSLDALAQQTTASLLKPLRVVFEGEPGVDEGGVRKEFFQLLVDQLFTPDFGMFEWLEESRCFWFSRASAALEAEAEFLLVGLVIGLAIHNGVILDLHFPHLLWLRLMNEPVDFSHLQQTHPDLWRGLHSLLTFDGDVENTFMADFTVTAEAFGAMTLTELVPNGENTPVTNDNRGEYTSLYADFLLVKSVQSQFDAFQKGFLLLCDGPAFSLLTPKELEQLACGVPHLDFHALQQNAVYDGGFHPEHPTIRHFWEVVHQMSTEDQRALLFFATGCDRAPVGGLGKLKFILQRAGDDAMDLPTSHTCFNLLAMPEYTSRAKLRDRLTIAIHNAQGFGLQ